MKRFIGPLLLAAALAVALIWTFSALSRPGNAGQQVTSEAVSTEAGGVEEDVKETTAAGPAAGETLPAAEETKESGGSVTETETAAGTTKSPSFAITENETSPPAEGGGEDPEGEEDSEAVTQDEASVLISERIIRPTLIREAQWCQEHWEDYRDRGLGDSPEELFASLYIRPIDFEYSTTGRTMNRLIEDAVGLYGADYHLLGLYYRNDAEYFTQEVQELIGQ